MTVLLATSLREVGIGDSEVVVGNAAVSRIPVSLLENALASPRADSSRAAKSCGDR